MSRSRGLGGLLLTTILIAPESEAQTVDFETVLMGTTWGAAMGQQPGDVVLTQDGVDMSVEYFFLDSFVGFVRAEVGGDFIDFFDTTPLSLRNISVRFDFTATGSDVSFVTIDYRTFGGINNFAVNDGPLHQVESLTDLPLNIAPGVLALVTDEQVGFVGNVETILLGGQEFAIDNVIAIPEPGLLGLTAIIAFAVPARRQLLRCR